MTRKSRVEFSEELMDDICAEYALCKPMREICSGKGRPHISTLVRWEHERPEVRELLDIAYRQGTMVLESELAELRAQKPKLDKEGRLDHGWVQWQRNQMDALRWQLAHRKPERYSDRTELVGAGGKDLIPPPVDPLEEKRRTTFWLHSLGVIDAEPVAPALPNRELGELGQQLAIAERQKAIAAEFFPVPIDAEPVAAYGPGLQPGDRRMRKVQDSGERRRTRDSDQYAPSDRRGTSGLPDTLGRQRATDGGLESYEGEKALRYRNTKTPGQFKVVMMRKPVTAPKG